MKVYTVDLYKEFNLEKKEDYAGELTCYLHHESKEINVDRIRPAMLVLGGGGYWGVSDREREPVSMEYFTQGFNVFELKYTCFPYKYPVPLVEAALAMAYIRANKEEFHIDENKVAAIGFSAGGHLLGMLSNLYNEPEVKAIVGDKNVKPDVAVFSYPVITSGKKTHGGSFENLCGDDKKLREKVSIEKRITKNSPPAFIWCTADDDCVPSENSLMLAAKYKELGLPFELHVFESGRHGLSVAKIESTPKGVSDFTNEAVEIWMPLSIKWLKNRGFFVKD